MTAPHPDERSLFLRALEIGSAPERAAFLDETCGADRRLRDGVEALLRGHDRPLPLLDVPVADDPTGEGRPAVGTTVHRAPSSDAPGGVVGPYKLLQQLGEGGMGTVYMAEQ